MERERDLQAVYQGVALVLSGALAILIEVRRDKPTDQAEQIGVFVGWMLAIGAISFGITLFRTGLERQYYQRHAARVVMTIVATCVLMVSAYGGLAAAGIAPLPSSFDAKPVHVPKDAITAPKGWRKEDATTFTSGTHASPRVASVIVFDVQDADIGKDERTELLDLVHDSLKLKRAKRVTARDERTLSGMPVSRSTSTGVLKGSGRLVFDTYLVHDADSGRLWTVTFAQHLPRPARMLHTQRAFLEALPYDDAFATR